MRISGVVLAICVSGNMATATAQQTCLSEYVDYREQRGMYLGECVDGVPQGSGRVEFYDGGTFVGSFDKGKSAGFGRWESVDGEAYEGENRNGMPHGPGTYFYPNGGVFKGEYRDGELNGKGHYTTPEGYVFSATFVDGLAQGTGYQVFPNGDRYDGEYVDSRREGQGTLTFANGARYTGSFLHERPSGDGRLVVGPERVYVGTWLNGTVQQFSTCPRIDFCRSEPDWGELEEQFLLRCPELADLTQWEGCADTLVSRKIGNAQLIHIYTRYANFAAVAQLLEFGADPNVYNGDGDTPLHIAVGSGNDEIANLLLDNGADANLPQGEFGSLPVMLALQSSDEVFDRLLQDTKDVNAADFSGQTYLHFLSIGGEGAARFMNETNGSLGRLSDSAPLMLKLHRQKVQESLSGTDMSELADSMAALADSFNYRFDRLMKRKPLVDALNLAGKAPLHIAVMGQNLRAINKLIDAGASLDVGDIEGQTPLYVAAGISGEDVDPIILVSALMDAGADVHKPTVSGATPLHNAAWENNTTVAQALLDAGANPHARDSSGFTPLLNAVEKGHLEMARLLVASESRIDEATNDGEPALSIAAHNDNPELLAYLLSQGADPNMRTGKDGSSALHSAAGRGLIDNVTLLLDAGADISTDLELLGTPLHSAMWGRTGKLDQFRGLQQDPANLERIETLNLTAADEEDYRAVTDRLLSLGADIEANASSMTPLHVAAAKGYIYGARRLIEEGANERAVDNRNWNALHFLANESGSYIIADLLLKAGTPVDAVTDPGYGQRASTPLGFAAARGHADLAQLLLENGAAVNHRNELEATPLHRATNDNFVDVIRVLIDHGADIEARDNLGGTALHVAAGMGHAESVELLLEFGADIDAPGPMPQLATPLHLAAYKGATEVVRILVDRGANKEMLTLQGYSALDIAATQMHGDVVEILQN